MSIKDKISSLIPLEDLEVSAQQQIYATAEKDFVMKLAIMPDCHTGYDLPIGAVALMDNVISASAVGYDIGCGMCYVDTGVPVTDVNLHTKKGREKVMHQILRDVPMGTGMELDDSIIYTPYSKDLVDKDTYEQVSSKAIKQLGTLGGGNHFIEIGETDGIVTITIHSGSRKPGHSTAGYFMKLHDEGLPNGYFYLESEFGQKYYTALKWAEQYALSNRKTMIMNILRILFNGDMQFISKLLDENLVNENHNHANIVDDGVIHRKGATEAHEGQIGVIPINIRDGVYVTEGLGNDNYLSSSSHGAGRKMSRKKAKQNLDVNKFLGLKKVITSNITESALDEAPEAYKDADTVISAQNGIVLNVISKTEPIIVLKGD